MGRQVHATLLNPFVSQRLTMVMNKEHYSGLERLTAFAEDGAVASFWTAPSPWRRRRRRQAPRGRTRHGQGRHHRLITLAGVSPTPVAPPSADRWRSARVDEAGRDRVATGSTVDPAARAHVSEPTAAS